MNHRRAFVLVLFLGQIGLHASAQVGAPLHAPLPLNAPVQDKNFFLLSLIERTAPASDAIGSDGELRQLARGKREALRKAVTTCGIDVECFATAMQLTDTEVSQGADAMRRLYKGSEPLRAMTDGPLRRSGTYVRYGAKSGDELLAAAWLDAARGIDNIIDVYGRGKAPRSPAIDSVSYDVKGRAYGQLVSTVAALLDEDGAAGTLFFEPSLRFALYLLQINHRDEAGRHEPLEATENAVSLRHLAAIRWAEFPYSLILVPGFGPDRPGWSFSPEGKLRVEIAARRYKEGKAPLIVVSGGYVHPDQTPYAEALEMRKSLIADFGVPADAIIVEPHARHTTTNLRNTARLMYRYGIPFDRKALITTDGFHSAYIGGAAFAERCNKDLGYEPATILGRVSVFDLEFTPRVESLQIDPMDPLDP